MPEPRPHAAAAPGAGAALDDDPPAGRQSGRRRRLLMPAIAVLVVSLAGFLLYRTLSGYSLDEIVASVRSIPLPRLLAAGAFAAASYLCLTGFDWLGVRYAGRPLPYRKVALASFVSLSIGHNVGLAALSSGAIRYRFYSRWGLKAGEVAKVILFCGMTVGLGLMLLGGAAMLLRSDLTGEITGLPAALVLAAGAGCVALPLVYLVLAAYVRRPLRIRSFTLHFPPLRLALGQLVIGPLNFAMVAGCLHQALAAVADVSYMAVATVYVIANVTALISHVPGGLGVIESVVVFLLPGAQLIGALLVFRVIYFLVPLSLGGPAFAITELVFRRRAASSDGGGRRPES